MLGIAGDEISPAPRTAIGGESSHKQPEHPVKLLPLTSFAPSNVTPTTPSPALSTLVPQSETESGSMSTSLGEHNQMTTPGAIPSPAVVATAVPTSAESSRPPAREGNAARTSLASKPTASTPMKPPPRTQVDRPFVQPHTEPIPDRVGDQGSKGRHGVSPDAGSYHEEAPSTAAKGNAEALKEIQGLLDFTWEHEGSTCNASVV